MKMMMNLALSLFLSLALSIYISVINCPTISFQKFVDRHLDPLPG